MTLAMMIDDPSVSILSQWKDFYVIVGSSAGALTGLQFVTMTLIAESQTSDKRAVQAFGSPTVVHFCVALLVSALGSCPWQRMLPVAVALSCCGVGGFIYATVAVRHAKKQKSYQPDWEDWMWYGWLPLVTYAVLALAGVLIIAAGIRGLFVVAAVCLALLFIGIHNSWDSVTYLAVNRPGKD